MFGDVIIIDVFALGDFVVDRFLKTEEGNTGDGERDSWFASHDIIFVSDGVDYIVEVAGCCVGTFGDDLKHPWSIFIYYGEGDVCVLFNVEVWFAEL